MAIPEYDELKVRIEPRGDGSYDVVAFAPDGGIARGRFRSPISALELENFVLRVASPRSVRAYHSSNMEEAKQLGGVLFDRLLSDDVGDVYQGARRVADSQGRGLRISLSMTGAPELLEMPWELLYDPGEAFFLSQSIFTPVVRSLDLKNPPAAPKLTLPFHVLAFVSSPEGLPKLDTEAERAKLTQALSTLVDSGTVRLEWLESATLAELDRRIAAPNELHVIHYIGHGAYDKRTQGGILALEDARGMLHEVTGEELGGLMRDERSLRLVVLNSCEGSRGSHVDPFSGVASSLLRCGLPAVIGMQAEITDEAAITFSDRLYTALAQGFPVDAALAQARRAIFAAGKDVEFGTPVLFMRVADGRIFEISDDSPPPPPPPVGRLEVGLDASRERLREGGTVRWNLGIRNAGDSAIREVIARDQAGELRAGPLALGPGEKHECSWTDIGEHDVYEAVTVGGRGPDGRLVSAQANAHARVRKASPWRPSKGVLAGAAALVLLAAVVGVVAIGQGPAPDPQPDDRVFNAGTDVPDIDARGDKVVFLASAGTGEATEIRRLNLGSWRAEDVAPEAPKHYGVDMGLNEARRAQLVYSSCAVPAACDLYRKPLRGSPRRLPASTDECSETRPSMWAGLVLYARQGPSCGKQLMLSRANNPESQPIAGDTGGADLNDGIIVWLSKRGGALVAKRVDAAASVTSLGMLRPPPGEQFGTPIVVEGNYVYFTHGQGSASFIARVELPPRDDWDIEHYVPGDKVAEAEEAPHFGVTGDTLYVTNYPQPSGEPGAGKIVRVRNPAFEPAE